MPGHRADADDVVQDACLRWHGTDQAAVQSPEAWLVTITTRLALDRLRSRKSKGDAYSGWWLPEPLVELDERTPESAAELANDVSVAVMWVLERLAPEERADFLIRQVFDQDYSDIAAMLNKSEASCRQLVHRAQARVKQERSRFEMPKNTHRELLANFMQAAGNGDRAAMKAMMSDDVQLVADGGGKVNLFQHILHGAGRVAGVYWALEHQNRSQVAYRAATVNGGVCFVTSAARSNRRNRSLSTTAASQPSSSSQSRPTHHRAAIHLRSVRHRLNSGLVFLGLTKR